MKTLDLRECQPAEVQLTSAQRAALHGYGTGESRSRPSEAAGLRTGAATAGGDFRELIRKEHSRE